MAVAGLRGTGDWGTDERPKNFREFILWAEPNGNAPLTALMARTRSEGLDDPEFSWWEEIQGPVRLQINGVVTTGQTSVVIDDGDAEDLVAGDVLLVETATNGPVNETYTNELIEVSSVTNTTTFVVLRGRAGTTAATITDDWYLTKIGNVYEEGSTSPNATTRNPTKYKNYAQIFKTAYRITETAKLTRARTGPALQNDKRRKTFDHSVALEYSYLFGKQAEITGANGEPQRYTGGLLERLASRKASDPTNAAHSVKVWTTTPTEDTLLDAVYKIWDFQIGGRGGTNERIGLAGNGFLNSLNKLARTSSSTRINFDSVIKLYGMNLARWIFPQGEVLIRTHPLMNRHGAFTNACFFINPGTLVDRTMRKTRPQNNIQANDADEEKGQWLTESGAEYWYPQTMTYQGEFIV